VSRKSKTSASVLSTNADNADKASKVHEATPPRKPVRTPRPEAEFVEVKIPAHVYHLARTFALYMRQDVDEYIAEAVLGSATADADDISCTEGRPRT
jgi:hypothetical protein